MISSTIINSISKTMGVQNSPFYKYEPIKKTINNFWKYQDPRHKDFEILGMYKYDDVRPMRYETVLFGGMKAIAEEARHDGKPTLMTFIGYPTYYLPNKLSGNDLHVIEDTRMEIPGGRNPLFCEIFYNEDEDVWMATKIRSFYYGLVLNNPDSLNKIRKWNDPPSLVGLSFKLQILFNIYDEAEFQQYSSESDEPSLNVGHDFY